MRLLSCVVAAALAVVGVSAVQAQLIGSVTVSPQNVQAGEPVTVTANVGVLGGNYCGFAVFYGDGASVESYSDVKKPTPFVSTHVYDKPGTYTISMGGRHVESRPNCGGPDKFATLTVMPGAKSMAGAPVAKPATPCPAPWKLSGKWNAKTGAYTCVAKAKTAFPDPRPACPGDLTYFENAKKGQFGCRP